MYEYKAMIDRVIDGDTVVATIDVGFDIKIKKHIRLLGIDAPEKGQKGYADACDFLTLVLTKEEVTIQTEKADSFGRYLGWIFLGETNVNIEMISKGHAVKRDGK